ncbi:unnamed protein product [Adineta ricciae]|uniref:G domain-containing protein n=1 Tax=Adineta ricciae TaxID=249248 RepID=A0A813YCC2_ADIRI|nr:unnamed protein product [Adineta ricciae]
MASEKVRIQIYVRRTGEHVLIDVIPKLTTFGSIVKTVCERINDPEPSHYYISLNNEKEMFDDMVFEPSHASEQFQMIMRTKWLLEHIAAQAMRRQGIKPVETKEIQAEATAVDEPSVPTETSVNETPAHESAAATAIVANPSKEENTTTEQNKPILGDVVRETIRRIPRRDVQKYIHRSLEKSFDILLMGSPRVGKSTLINAILKKDLARTSAGRNACTNSMSYYEYEETYTTFEDSRKPITSTCSIRIWDSPGIENWDELDIAQHIRNLVKEKNPICLIYCASPGCYASVEHMKVIIEQCIELGVFIALVVTNMYASDEVDDILETYQDLLVTHMIRTQVVDDVYYYGTIGLCTAVNSVKYENEGIVKPPTGVDELMLGIMNSLSEEKLLQWCFALMDNGPFWVRAQSRIWKTFKLFKSWIGY